MKRLITIIAAVAVLFAGCKQNDVDPTSGNKVTVTNEKVTNIDPTCVEVSGTYSYASNLDGIYVLVSASSDMANAKAFESVLNGKDFAATVTELKENTKYYYKYRYVNMGAELESEAVKSFTTLKYGVPYVTTLDVTKITENSAVCGGEVTFGGGYAVTARGVCWSTSQNPTTSNNHTTDGSGTGSFTSYITGLTQATTYYVRAYAINEKGTGYGDAVCFKTQSSVIDYSNLILNELNGTDKFIEFYNKGNLDLSVEGMYLVKDDGTGPTWTGAAGTVVPAHGYLLLYSEDVVFHGGAQEGYPEELVFHSGLSAKKAIKYALYMPDGSERDVFTRGEEWGLWGVTISNVAPQSYARTPDGGEWKLADPTSGQANPDNGEEIPQE